VAADARRRGLAVGPLLGTGGYAVVVEAVSPQHGPCALKVPWVTPADEHPDAVPAGRGPNRIEQVSETGPFVLTGPRTLDEAAALLERACARQRRSGDAGPLARLHEVVELGGRPAALLERAPGESLRSSVDGDPARARRVMPGVARALQALHDAFGGHGDLKPDHIFVDGDEVRFVDPLGDDSEWMGSIGYALPFVAQTAGPLAADLAALAAVLAEVWGGTVGWDGRLAYALVNQLNGRFGRYLPPEQVLARMREGLRGVPPPVASWVLEVGRTVLRVRPAAGGHATPDAAWCRARLSALAAMRPDGPAAEPAGAPGVEPPTP
jgi:hypothetical protein